MVAKKQLDTLRADVFLGKTNMPLRFTSALDNERSHVFKFYTQGREGHSHYIYIVIIMAAADLVTP